MPEGKRGDRELIARVTADYRRAYAAGWRNNTRPYDGIPELLDELGRRGLRRAVLSNKPDDTTRATVQAFLGLDRFGVVRGAMEGVPLKPDPAATLAIARQVDVPPERFLYVGDTATDMQTAHAAGMFPVGALWGFRDADELTAAGAERLIEQPAQLLELL
jgi:phosphoglycolate phosphatase